MYRAAKSHGERHRNSYYYLSATGHYYRTKAIHGHIRRTAILHPALDPESIVCRYGVPATRKPAQKTQDRLQPDSLSSSTDTLYCTVDVSDVEGVERDSVSASKMRQVTEKEMRKREEKGYI